MTSIDGKELSGTIDKIAGKNGVFHECQVQGFFEISELKFTFVNEHFKN